MAAIAPRLLWTETVTFTDEAIHFVGEFEDKRLKWTIFSDASVAEKVILLMVDKGMFYYFHKHQFTDSEFAELSQKAKQFVKAKKYRDA